MNVKLIKIKNLFGLSEKTLDGKSVELQGDNGTGKTSVIDAIRFALTNSSEREYIIKNGTDEGEILIETDTNLSINRKKRAEQADYKSITKDNVPVARPESFLKEIFTEMQINPVEFTQKTSEEQNRIILDLIEFKWDINWIAKQFGEIPEGINYDQNILRVLEEIQSDDGFYYKKRRTLNTEMRVGKDHIEKIAKDIPDKYNYEKWNTFDISAKYRELAQIVAYNNNIERSKEFKQSYNDKIAKINAESEVEIANIRAVHVKECNNTKMMIQELENKLTSFSEKVERDIEKVRLETKSEIDKTDSHLEIAGKHATQPRADTEEIEKEIDVVEEMRKHLNEYARMLTLQGELEGKKDSADELTAKIELARTLPAQILKEAKLPIDNLTVVKGMAHVNGKPVSNLSEGEKLQLCVDVAISNPKKLNIILLDGTERLSDKNRKMLYAKCLEKGLQFIASRTTNDDELKVVTLGGK